MSYATKSDMQRRFGDVELQQLTDISTPRTGAIVDAVLQDALDGASTWIDSYLMGRYPLPISDAAALAVLKMHCVDEARYRLMNVHPDDQAQKQHDERERYFRAIAQGLALLIAPANVPPAEGVGSVIFAPGDKVFGREGTDDSTSSWRAV